MEADSLCEPSIPLARFAIRDGTKVTQKSVI